MSITKGIGFATPSSNTGSSVRFSSKVDWLQGLLRLTPLQFQTFIGEISNIFKDVFASDGGYFFSGRTFNHHRVSDRGGRIAWNILDFVSSQHGDRHQLDERIIDCWFCLPAQLLNGCESTFALRRFILLLSEFEFKPSRIDLALDDYTKSLTWRNFDDARKAGQAYGFKKGRLTTSFGDVLGDGFTYYMGSSGSDKLYRFYDKNVESNGENDCYRLEAQFRDDWCKSVWASLLAADTDKKIHQTIVDCVCQPIDFYDVDEDSGEKIPLQWWSDFKDLVLFLGVNLSCGRIKTSIERSLEWVEKSVERTLATIETYYERIEQDFGEYLNARLEAGRRKIRSVHETQIKSALLQLGVTDSISYKDACQGFF